LFQNNNEKLKLYLPRNEEGFKLRNVATVQFRKLFHYTPRRLRGGEEVELLLILDFGTRWW
jgi:hypothetical protein